MRQAIAAGKGPDVGLSYSTDIVGNFCSTGAWRDLKPYLERDKVDLNQLPPIVRGYTEYRRHALLDADAGRHVRPLLQQEDARRRPATTRRRRP